MHDRSKNLNTKIKYSVIGPVMNEAGNLEEYVDRCKRGFQKKSDTFEIIIVDDGSTDGSDVVLQKIIKDNRNINIVLLEHRRNFGLTKALQTGFTHARGEHLIWISTDLEAHPDEDIPKFISGFNEGADVVVGSRIGRGDGKNLASSIYNQFCRRLFGVQLKDMNWTKAFKKECLGHLELRSDWHRFIVVMLHNSGFKIIEKEMNWHPRRYGRSKFGLMRFPISIIDALGVFFYIKFRQHPMRFFGSLGLAFGILGVFCHLFLLALYFTNQTQIRPLFWLALSFMLVSLNLVMFGFVSELLVSRDPKNHLK